MFENWKIIRSTDTTFEENILLLRIINDNEITSELSHSQSDDQDEIEVIDSEEKRDEFDSRKSVSAIITDVNQFSLSQAEF